MRILLSSLYSPIRMSFLDPVREALTCTHHHLLLQISSWICNITLSIQPHPHASTISLHPRKTEELCSSCGNPEPLDPSFRSPKWVPTIPCTHRIHSFPMQGLQVLLDLSKCQTLSSKLDHCSVSSGQTSSYPQRTKDSVKQVSSMRTHDREAFFAATKQSAKLAYPSNTMELVGASAGFGPDLGT